MTHVVDGEHLGLASLSFSSYESWSSWSDIVGGAVASHPIETMARHAMAGNILARGTSTMNLRSGAKRTHIRARPCRFCGTLTLVRIEAFKGYGWQDLQPLRNIADLVA